MTAPLRTMLSTTMTLPWRDSLTAQSDNSGEIGAIRVDECEVERLLFFGEELRQRLERRPNANLHATRQPRAQHVVARNLRASRLTPG